jgi:hypothetical protein
MTLSVATSVAPADDPQPASEQSPKFEAYPHQPVAYELRRAWLTAKTLAEQIELANLRGLHRVVVGIREELFLELMRVEGYAEIEPEVVPDPA